MPRLRQSLGMTLRSLAQHRLRTILAMLGVFLGALALTAVLHITRAMSAKADLEIQRLGPNLLQAASGQASFRREGTARITGGTITFTLEDAHVILTQVPQVRQGVPYCQGSRSVRVGNLTTNSRLIGSPPAYARVRLLELLAGRFYTEAEEAERARVCVLGYSIATRLFRRAENAVGKQALFRGAPFTIIGVVVEQGRDLTGTTLDEQDYVPLSTYMRRLSNQDWISGVYMNLHNSPNPDLTERGAIAEITRILRERHHIVPPKLDDFSVLSSRDASRLRNQALELVWMLGVLSSVISFAVGALGILSIMILLVRARRLEIGVRRAVGASRKTIMRQFLAEAGIMSGIGGTTGVIAALGIITAVYRIGAFPYLYIPWIIVGACLASAAIGLAAGAYPAWEASRVEVLEVLRNPE